MSKRAVSVTIEQDNLLWLRGKVAAGASGSVSELIDDLVTEARASGVGVERGIRSVVGTIDIAAPDPDLLVADSYVRSQFDRSLRRPALVRERPPRKRRTRG
ncbi:MAG: hypothetical protein ACM36C_01310 [Acidobacteriota bacterium]